MVLSAFVLLETTPRFLDGNYAEGASIQCERAGVAQAPVLVYAAGRDGSEACMLHLRMTVAALATLLAAPALAQGTPQTPPAVASPLPTPAIDENAPPQAFIEAALHALATGRVAEAQEAIERAETRLLARAVKPSLADQPSQQPLVQQLSQARQALAAGDKLGAVGLLEAAAKNPEATKAE